MGHDGTSAYTQAVPGSTCSTDVRGVLVCAAGGGGRLQGWYNLLRL